MRNELESKIQEFQCRRTILETGDEQRKIFIMQITRILNEFANQIEPDAEAFSSRFEDALDAFSRAIDIKTDGTAGLSLDKVDAYQQKFDNLSEAIESTLTKFVDFLSAIQDIPRADKELTKAKNNMELKIRLLINNMEITVELIKVMQQRFRDRA